MNNQQIQKLRKLLYGRPVKNVDVCKSISSFCFILKEAFLIHPIFNKNVWVLMKIDNFTLSNQGELKKWQF